MKNQNALNWLLFVLLCLTWGSSFILMKTGLRVLSPYQVASIRIIGAGIIMLPLARKAFREVPKSLIKPVILSGFLGTFIPAFLFCIAGTRVDSALSGILNALTPIFTVAIGTAFFNLKIGWMKWLGMVLGFAGMLVLLLGGVNTIDTTYLGYALLILLATVCYGLNVNVVNQYLKDAAPLNIASIAFTALIIPTLLILAATGYFTSPEVLTEDWNRATLISLFLGVVSTAAASVIFYLLMKRAGPVFASMVTYGIPFVALGWGLLDGETVTYTQVAGLLVILLGVRIANK